MMTVGVELGEAYTFRLCRLVTCLAAEFVRLVHSTDAERTGRGTPYTLKSRIVGS
jgi:hypothetical protein